MVDDDHPAGCSSLLLTAWKLARWVEARDPLFPKVTPMEGSNITHSQILGNLCPSWKLKGSHTFTARSAMVESNRVAEDLGTKEEETGEVESSDGEDPETLGISSVLAMWSSCIRRKTKIA